MAADYLQSGVVFLAAAVITVPLAQRCGLGSVLGYLLAGIAIGPWGLALIRDVEAILHFAEFGVVLLLFLIGLELNPKKLWQMRKPIIGLGGGQLLLTALALLLPMWWFGIELNVAVIIALALGLSSTAVALKLIEEQGMGGSEAGQAGFAVLLFQDIAVIPILALLPVLAGSGEQDGLASGYVAAGIALLLVGGHFLLRPLFRWVVMSGVRELFNVAALLLVFGISLLMDWLGLSMALGAFLAGVLLAESEYRHELEIAIEPFKGLLLGLFFIAVGMTVNLDLLWQFPLYIALAVMVLVGIKMAVLYVLAHVMGLAARSRSQLAAVLSQGGEFAFVIFTAAQSESVLSAELSAILLVVVSLSMMTTPLLLVVQRRWYQWRFTLAGTEARRPSVDDIKNDNPRVIIAGFGRFGQVVGRLLFANKIAVTVLERDPSQITLLRKFGYRVYYGDATQLNLLRAAGADKAEAIVVCTDSPDEVLEVVELCQHYFPHLKVLARARSRVEAYQLLSHGVENFSRETFDGALNLGRQTLVALGMHPYKAKRAESHFRRLDLTVLRDLLPQHSDDSSLASRAQEARQELEEIFDREMQRERESLTGWGHHQAESQE
ncbi:glutathione-regulated potassium-efflux system protein KefB [Thaumasiovibrio sp. DFM-14]|uniref:glutathione-regulated potassium-efflux system protein KefB n=1 Tax=Thaumasiovibrio sp. DFM-14 TaxID=3384792 RepID=UPI0039A042B9